MFDLSHLSALDEWLSEVAKEADSSESQLPSPSSSHSSSRKLLIDECDPLETDVHSESCSEDASNVKKRKHEEQLDVNENKKSKNLPLYIRRNIRQILSDDQLQSNTLSARKAEQERLQRLGDGNIQYQRFDPLTNCTFTNNDTPIRTTPIKQEFTVLDDDDDHDDYSRSMNLLTQNTNSDDKQYEVKSDEDTDSDTQSVDGETDYANDKLNRRLRRLHICDFVNVPNPNGDVSININHQNNEEDLYVAKHLSEILKPHQIGGIRFMYDNIIESLERFRTTDGLGCILAHSMGCGKTLQVVAFVDVLLRYEIVRSILIIVPINTIQNWNNEFHHWCPKNDPMIGYKRSYQLYVLNDTIKKAKERVEFVQNWSRTGGVLIMGYEMFRLLVNGGSSQTSTSVNYDDTIHGASTKTMVTLNDKENENNFAMTEDITSILTKPDIVVCDEGHRIKNHHANISKVLKSIKTRRRIVLTGYPLQNNLIEYWCMVDFVRPNYLGSRKEFRNMFEKPILNGRCINSTASDIQLMRERSHVLHSLLEGLVQRRNHDVLRHVLPAKNEYVILLRLSPVQQQLYMKLLETIGALSDENEKIKMKVVTLFAICCKIWNHPDALYDFVRDRKGDADSDLDIEIDQNLNITKQSSTSEINLNSFDAASSIASTSMTNGIGEDVVQNFSTNTTDIYYNSVKSMLNSYVTDYLSNGIKFEVALTIIDLSIKAGDKVLLFSQSLFSLNKIEDFLRQREIPNTQERWQKNINYYRLDGSTNALEREKLINGFNAPNSVVKLFLLSTRAGSLGVNLIGANRVIIMDVSWNPCHDVQAICRVYRYGQTKPCYVYRLIADYTIEKRMYDRQIAKQGVADRVVDELQPQSRLTEEEVNNLIYFAKQETSPPPDLLTRVQEMSDDSILVSICQQYSQSITKEPFMHESLLCDQKEDRLTSADKRRAKREYKSEKQNKTYLNRTKFSTCRRSWLPQRNSVYFNEYNQEYNQYQYSSILPISDNSYAMNTIDQKPSEPLQSPPKGFSVKNVTLTKPLEVKLNGFNRTTIPVGSKVYLFESAYQSYVKTMDGKCFLIRQSTSTTTDQSQSMPAIPGFPLQPAIQSQASEVNNEFDNASINQILSMASTSMLSPLTDDEIDLLIRDINDIPSSSATVNENTCSYNDDNFKDCLDFDWFPTQANLPVSSNNVNLLDFTRDILSNF